MFKDGTNTRLIWLLTVLAVISAIVAVGGIRFAETVVLDRQAQVMVKGWYGTVSRKEGAFPAMSGNGTDCHAFDIACHVSGILDIRRYDGTGRLVEHRDTRTSDENASHHSGAEIQRSVPKTVVQTTIPLGGDGGPAGRVEVSVDMSHHFANLREIGNYAIGVFLSVIALASLIAAVLIVRNIRYREIQEACLRQSNEDLQNFAYIAAHDLREPLRAIDSYLKLLRRRYGEKLGADAEEFIDFAVDGAKRMGELIDGLLAYSRVETQGHPMAPTSTADVVENALRDLRPAIEDARASVTLSELPTVGGDEAQLTDLFRNLIGNAIKYRDDVRPLEVRIAAEVRGPEWLFSVSDTGIGIAPEHRKRIFLLFQRLHTREERPGTGIGLAVCQRIVERHGGKIWVDSTPGQGSTFYFTLPRK